MASRDYQAAFNQFRSELQSLDSKVRVVAQRMRIIEKNEQIIGKTLVNHNRKLKELESGTSSFHPPQVSSAPISEPVVKSEVASELNIQVEKLNSLVADLVKEINYNRELIDNMRQDINEMKYILDTVNPMEYVTINQVKDLIDEKIKK